jgi:[acyl-carrier-protein] S-malonyltransferase
VIVGYSMGLYAALYAAGFYAFETGLEIVERAYQMVREHCRDRCSEHGMGLLLGFTAAEIESLLLDEMCGRVTVAMRNGTRSFILAGEKESLEACLDKAHREGALCARVLAAKHPYHTELLKGMESDFMAYLNSLSYTEPHTPVPSLVTHRVIDRSTVAEEIAMAMFNPLTLDTVVSLLAERFGIEYGVDIGPKQSMKKLVRYIDHSLKVHPYREVLQR